MSDMSDDTDGQVQAGRWATIPEAATHFRKATRTIERWAETGRLRRHPEARPVLVWIASSDSPTETSDMSDDNVGQREIDEDAALARVERLYDIVRQQALPLAEALARTELRASQAEALAMILARENGQQQERIAALERVVDTLRQMSDADRQEVVAAEGRADLLAAAAEAARRRASELADEMEQARQTAARPWWRKILG